MIKNIVFTSLFACMLLALALALFGVQKVELGAPALAFLKNCSYELNEFKIEIPDIPMIKSLKLQSENGFVNILFGILNVLIGFVNALSTFLNIIADIINVIIQLIQFAVIIIKNLITMRDTLIEQANSSSESESIFDSVTSVFSHYDSTFGPE